MYGKRNRVYCAAYCDSLQSNSDEIDGIKEMAVRLRFYCRRIWAVSPHTVWFDVFECVFVFASYFTEYNNSLQVSPPGRISSLHAYIQQMLVFAFYCVVLFRGTRDISLIKRNVLPDVWIIVCCYNENVAIGKSHLICKWFWYKTGMDDTFCLWETNG